MEHSEEAQRRKFWLWAVTFIVLIALLGILGGAYVNRATSAPARPSSSTTTAMRCVSDAGMACSIRHNVRAFKRGDLGRIKGYKSRVDDLYRHPRAAKRVFIRKIKRAIVRRNSRLIAAGVSPRVTTSAARSLYRQSIASSSCMGAGNYPAWATKKGTCSSAPPSGPGLTKRQVQVGGAVALCGAGVVLGVVTAPATAGASVYYVAGVGGLGCLWGFWSQVDPG
jgi:hypothetical protein